MLTTKIVLGFIYDVGGVNDYVCIHTYIYD